MRSTVDVADVRVLDDRARKDAERATPPRPPRSPGTPAANPDDGSDPAGGAAESTYARTVDGTLDLRGERVDAAFDRIDKFIDDSLLASREVICLLHGHGTGALRAAVREHVSAHPMVAKLRPGTPPEGGDGVTMVWLG
jgi:DNA mismatch repair protein MutS2